MNEAPAAAAAAATGATAGRLLREAREKQGLHIAALAAAIKVPQKKLEALENDRYGDLPDATFARALAQTVCRALKADPAPVLALLPRAGGHRLEQVGEGLNTPFRERPGSLLPGDWTQLVASPVLWLTAFVLVAALVVYLLPKSGGWLGSTRAEPAAGPASAAVPVADTGIDASGPAPGGELITTTSSALAAPPATTGSSPAPAMAEPSGASTAPIVAAAAVPAASADSTGLLQVRTSGKSWVEVTDARGAPLVARLLLPGESVGVDGVPPFRVRIGNAAATQIVYRGQATDLAGYTRDNVARFELK